MSSQDQITLLYFINQCTHITPCFFYVFKNILHLSMNLYNILNNRYCLLYLNTDNLSIIPEFLPVILINILYCMLIYFQHFNSTAHVTIKKHLSLKKKRGAEPVQLTELLYWHKEMFMSFPRCRLFINHNFVFLGYTHWEFNDKDSEI